MEDSLYDATTHVLCIPKLPAALSVLVSRPPAGRREDPDKQRVQLSSHADAFARSLGKERPRYEKEEEREKLGGLRQCTWTSLDNVVGREEDDQRPGLWPGKKRRRKISRNGDDSDDEDGRPQLRGLAVSLIYEKDTFQFMIYTQSPRCSLSKRRRIATSKHQPSTEAEEESAILLSKASPTALKSFTKYLQDTFAVTTIYPFEPSSSQMQVTLERYLATIHKSLSSASPQSLHDSFSSILGKIEFTVSFSHPVATGLRSVHVAIPATAFLTWYNSVETPEGGNERGQKTFSESLAGWIKAKSGLCLPVLHEKDGMIAQQHNPGDGDTATVGSDNRDDPSNSSETSKAQDSPSSMTMKISRISTEAYTISAASGLKFKSRALHAVEGTSADTGTDADDRDNCVRRANRGLLLAIIEYTRPSHDKQQSHVIDGMTLADVT
ncbi:hypothetical protein AYO20_06556 [Fonsecaea nubica]|uniref:Uncharacterized protein n=1 Tax=Fonsecaea nubica TaxID=856822 RepID=A0A178CYS7_9EURO|nr:hypothetical protein AYO20_06556 [Fonsecaea nubica]OAL34101.1 hypothetical protein AYO20_06556 [Fonsecaea nubica]